MNWLSSFIPQNMKKKSVNKTTAEEHPAMDLQVEIPVNYNEFNVTRHNNACIRDSYQNRYT